jgi:hypothetical protein
VRLFHFHPMPFDDILILYLAPARVFIGSSIFTSNRPGLLILFGNSTIIDIEALCEAGEASMAYFYFDLRTGQRRKELSSG